MAYIFSLLLGLGIAASSMEPLVQDLIATDAGVRVQARKALVAAGHRSTPSLLEGLGAKEPKLRQACIAVLRELRDEMALDALQTTAKTDAAWMVRNAAIAALADPYVGRRFIASLSEIAQNDSDQINRNDAVKALSKILAAESIPLLKRLLEHPDVHTKVAAARELAVHGDASGFDAAMRGLQHDDRRVREKAASALRAIGDARALPALQRRIDDPGEDFRVKEVGIGAVRHIGLVARPKGERIAILSAGLNDEDRRVRSWAISEFVAEGGRDARSILDKVSRTPGHRAAAQAAHALKLLSHRNE